jgi:hypothetical protein
VDEKLGRLGLKSEGVLLPAGTDPANAFLLHLVEQVEVVVDALNLVNSSQVRGPNHRLKTYEAQSVHICVQVLLLYV